MIKFIQLDIRTRSTKYYTCVDIREVIIATEIEKKNNFFENLFRQNDRIVNVNGHPVVRYMEYTALKLIRESTDFVNLVY